MRSQAAIQAACDSLTWLLNRAESSPDSLAADHLLAALEWVLGDSPGNPLPELLGLIDEMRPKPVKNKPKPRGKANVGKPRRLFASPNAKNK